MSDNPTGSDQSTQVDAAQAFVDANVFYESEPNEPTDEDTVTDTEAADAATEEDAGQEQETTSSDDKPSTVKFEFDEETGTYSFKSNGETVEANIERLIENFSKGEGFTRKTTELSNKDKARAKEHSEAMASVKQREDELLALAETLDGLLQDESLDDKLIDDDPSEYLKQEKRIKARREQIETARKTVLDRRDAELKTVASREFARLKEVMGWDTQEKVAGGFNEISDYALSIGMSGDDVKSIYNHKIYMALSDAAKFRDLQAKMDNTVKEVKKAPQSVKSKKNPSPKQEKTAEQILYGT